MWIPLITSHGVPCAVCPHGAATVVDTGAPKSYRASCCNNLVGEMGQKMVVVSTTAPTFKSDVPVAGILGLDSFGPLSIVDIKRGRAGLNLAEEEFDDYINTFKMVMFEARLHKNGYITSPSDIGGEKGQWVVDTGSAVTTQSAEPKSCPLKKSMGTAVAGEVRACVIPQNVTIGGLQKKCETSVLTKPYLNIDGINGVAGTDTLSAVALDRRDPQHPKAYARLVACAPKAAVKKGSPSPPSPTSLVHTRKWLTSMLEPSQISPSIPQSCSG